MGYMGDGLPKWHFDRKRRKRLFDKLKSIQSVGDERSIAYPDQEGANERKTTTRLQRIQRIAVGVFRIGLFAWMFYAIYMILAYGKRW